MFRTENKEKIVCLGDLGNAIITKRKSSRRLCISIKSGSKITVSIPYWLSYTEGEKFLFSKQDWIRKSLTRIKTIERTNTFFDENTEFKTKYRSLKIQKVEINKIVAKIKADSIIIQVPITTDFSKTEIQKIIKDIVTKVYYIEAKEYLPKRVDYLAKLHGYKYNKLTFRNAKTRWGSCSSRNNLSLNVHLVRISEELSDFIILHELVHTIHKNHGKSFWLELDRVSGDVKSKNKALKSLRINCF